MTDTDDAGYTFFCYCGHGEAWTNEAAAMAASVWHVYQAHQDVWLSMAGDRQPVDPPPELLGRQLQVREQG